MNYPDDIWNIIREFLWSPLLTRNPEIISWPDYHPIITDAESRRAIQNVFLAHKAISKNKFHNRQTKSLMSYISCETCSKLKQDYRLPCCNLCLPKHLEITVTYKYTGPKTGHVLTDLKKIPKYEYKDIYNIKYILGFTDLSNFLKIPGLSENKKSRFKFISFYYLPTIPYLDE